LFPFYLIPLLLNDEQEDPEPQPNRPPTPLSITKALLGATAASKHPVFLREGEMPWDPRSINPPVKRIKREPTIEDTSSSVKPKKKAAKLSQLPLLPIDILYEVRHRLSDTARLTFDRSSRIFRL